MVRLGGRPAQVAPAVKVSVAQLCPALRDPKDRSPPGSSVHGILQARTLEWLAMPFSSGIFPTQGPDPGLPHGRQIMCARLHLAVSGGGRGQVVVFRRLGKDSRAARPAGAGG